MTYNWKLCFRRYLFDIIHVHLTIFEWIIYVYALMSKVGDHL